MGFRSASWSGITVKGQITGSAQLGWDRFRVVRAGCGLPNSSQPVTVEEPMSGLGFASVQAGNPLSERRLAQMFGRTSRRWARARIADARQASSIQESPGAPAMA
jgi:hypothetical protein